MKIQKPYKRIIRPFSLPSNYIHGPLENIYFADDKYAADRFEIIRAYYILEKDLIRLFDFIEPTDTNLSTYSHKTYELLLRASTEFELNARKILTANGYAKSSYWNVNDYYKLNTAMRLSEYRLFINVWGNGKKEIVPFSEWASASTLSWYQDYNSVKHNRHDEFPKASLKNVLFAVGAVFSIVFAQFHMLIFNQYQNTSSWRSDDNYELSGTNTLFSVILPQTWCKNEMYDFHWKDLKGSVDPCQKFVFQ